MPRKSYFNASEYFDTANGIMICKICKTRFTCLRTFNLRVHLDKVHKLTFSGNWKPKQLPQQKFKSKKIKCEISKEKLIQSYIGLVAEEGLSFDVLNSPHMRNIIEPLCKGFEKEGDGTKLFLNADNCKKAMAEVSRNIVKNISNECEQKLISLKVDRATISIQFIKNDKIVTRILGLLGINSTDNSDLIMEIMHTMDKYNMNLQQLVSITMDNSFKFLKYLGNSNAEMEKQTENFYDNKVYLQYIEKTANYTAFQVGDYAISACAAQQAQLVVLELITNNKIKKYIMNCRNIVKFLLLDAAADDYRLMYIETFLKLPNIDCPMLWGSTYCMIEDIRISKEIIATIKGVAKKSNEDNFEINEDLWNFIDAYCLALSPLQKAIMSFQEESMHYGDFYAKWLQCELIAQKKSDENIHNKSSHLYKINQALLEAIKKGTKNLFSSNYALTACLYLEPRFHHLLSPVQIHDAIEFLKNLWSKITATNKTELNTIPTSEIIIKSEEMDDEEGEEDGSESDILGEFLDQQFYTNNTTKCDDDVSTKIERLKIPYSKNISNVLAFWRERKQTDPELYALSNICSGIPATQPSTESSVMSVKPILSQDSNYNTKDNIFKNLVLVRLNLDFLSRSIAGLEMFFSQEEHTEE